MVTFSPHMFAPLSLIFTWSLYIISSSPPPHPLFFLLSHLLPSIFSSPHLPSLYLTSPPLPSPFLFSLHLSSPLLSPQLLGVLWISGWVTWLSCQWSPCKNADPSASSGNSHLIISYFENRWRPDLLDLSAFI